MENKFEKNKDKLIEFLKSKRNILAVYLFGSFVDNTYNENSDIDLAVLYDGKSDLGEHVSDSVDIEKIFDNTKIDYIDLEEVSLFFRFNILKNGKIIYIKDEEKLYDYVYKTQKSYIEMKYSRDKYEDYVLNHSSLKEDGEEYE